MKKLTLTMPNSSAARVKRLAAHTDDTEAGVIGKALQLYEGCVDVLDKGGSVFSEIDGERKPVMQAVPREALAPQT